MRIGCVVDAADTPWQRFDPAGNRIFGSDEKNNTVVTEFYEDRVFE